MPSRSDFLASAAGLTALSVASARPVRAAGLTPVRVAIAPSDGITSVLYAKKAGLFEKAGLDVQLDVQRNGAAVAAAILSGTYDLGNSSVTSIFLAHEKGLPFSLVAPAGIYDSKDPYSGALMLKTSPLRLDKDANNQTIGSASLAGIGHDSFCAWIDQHGGDPSSVHFVEISFTLAGPALQQHRIIAAEVAAPQLTTDLDTGDFRLVPIYDAIAPQFLVSVWFTSRTYSAQEPDVIRTFARVVSDAATYANTHHHDTETLVADVTGVPLTQVQRMPRSVQGTALNAALIQPAIDAAAKYGTLKASFPARELFDSALVK